MKKVINGKMYNTETAKCIYSYTNGYSMNDFNYVEEALYQKKTNEFFLYGSGGPMSRYCCSCGNSWGYGESITPITKEEAKEWAMEYLDGDEYESVFGPVEE